MITNHAKLPKYAKNLQVLADLIGMNRSHLSAKYMSLDGAPKKTTRGYNVKHCLEWIKQCDQDRLGETGDLRDEKLKREIAKLDIQIQQMRGELVTITEMQESIATICRVMLDGLAEFEARASAEYPTEPRMVEVAQGVVDRVRRYMEAKINEAEG